MTARVNIELLPDARDPQFTAIWGMWEDRRLEVGRLHNTALGVRDGLLHAFKNLVENVNERMGIPKHEAVDFGDFTWRFPLNKQITGMMIEAMGKAGMRVNGKFCQMTEKSARTFRSLSEATVSVTGDRVEKFSLSKYVGELMKGTGFPDALIKGLMGRVAAHVRIKLRNAGVNLDSSVTQQAAKRLPELPRVRYFVAQIAKTYRPLVDDSAYEELAKRLASHIAKELM